MRERPPTRRGLRQWQRAAFHTQTKDIHMLLEIVIASAVAGIVASAVSWALI
jgi:hypothetical protein